MLLHGLLAQIALSFILATVCRRFATHILEFVEEVAISV